MIKNSRDILDLQRAIGESLESGDLTLQKVDENGNSVPDDSSNVYRRAVDCHICNLSMEDSTDAYVYFLRVENDAIYEYHFCSKMCWKKYMEEELKSLE